jgi:CheY-like chemotaxis protein
MIDSSDFSAQSDYSASGVVATAPRRRVLVIDDSALVREAAKLALDTFDGWQVLTAASGEEGLALAATEQLDAILLDLVMPGMDGIAVAEHLRAIPSTRSLPIVLLTATDQAEAHERFQRAQVVGMIAKPFDIAHLSHQLAELLGWSL